MNKQDTNVLRTGYRLRVLTLADLDEKLISAWEDLETRTVEPNAFLSPHFVIPGIKHLCGESNVMALFVEKVSAGWADLVGVALFNRSHPSKHFPLPYLKAFDTKHSFLSGFLVDRDYASDVMKIIFDYLANPCGKWHAVVIQNCATDGLLAKIENETAEAHSMKWISYREWQRAALHPSDAVEDLQNSISKNVKKTVRRRMRRLNELGDVNWQIHFKDTLTPDDIETLMKLENMGWKGEQGTSIQSNCKDAAFFQEMILRFQRAGRILFNELILNNNVISSAVKLVSGNTAFAFKIGWDPAYFKYSPGFLNESKWLDAKCDIPIHLDLIDSGASEDATYMNELWPQRRSLKSGVYAITNTGKMALPVVGLMAQIKNSKLVKLSRQHKTESM